MYILCKSVLKESLELNLLLRKEIININHNKVAFKKSQGVGKGKGVFRVVHSRNKVAIDR